MIFQAYSLWPHMSVAENVAYPLRRRKLPQAEIRQRVDAALDLVRCTALAGQHPGQLSGGQQQRIALARAIIAEPAVLLFDEPLSNLDANLRHQLRNEIAALHARLGFSGIYVTHDQAEALSLGSKVAVMNTARIEQVAAPQELHDRPASAYVAAFLGANLIEGTTNGGGGIDTAFGPLRSAGRVGPGPVTLAAYPQRIEVAANPQGVASIIAVNYMGASVEYTLEAGGATLNVIVPAHGVILAPGTRADPAILPENVLAFPKQGTSARQ
jgi:ABC-type Fe3+/spermidine/putrescine transport system ATPase subunit